MLSLASRRPPAALRYTFAVAFAAAACLSVADTARADSANLTITTSAGQSDPVAGVARVFAISGNVPDQRRLYVKYRPVGGAACAPSAASDSGNDLDSDSGYGYYSQYIEGDYKAQMAKTWRTPGSFLFCIWLSDNEADVATPFSQVVTFRRLNGTITATVSPVIPRPGQLTTFSVSGSAEAPLLAFTKLRPAGGAPCAASAESDTGEGLIDGRSVEGAFGLQTATTPAKPGSYLLCLWLAQSATDAAPIAAQSQTFDVVQPPPVVKRARTVNCQTKRRLSRISARRTKAVCLRYSFVTRPLAGDRLTLRFTSPRKRTVKRVRFTYVGQPSSVVIGRLLRRSYRNRRGNWTATLSAGNRQLSRSFFKVR